MLINHFYYENNHKQVYITHVLKIYQTNRYEKK